VFYHRGALALYKASRRANIHSTIVGLSNTRIASVSIMHVDMDEHFLHFAENAHIEIETSR
jgi:hypothetical protein